MNSISEYDKNYLLGVFSAIARFNARSSKDGNGLYQLLLRKQHDGFIDYMCETLGISKDSIVISESKRRNSDTLYCVNVNDRTLFEFLDRNGEFVSFVGLQYNYTNIKYFTYGLIEGGSVISDRRTSVNGRRLPRVILTSLNGELLSTVGSYLYGKYNIPYHHFGTINRRMRDYTLIYERIFWQSRECTMLYNFLYNDRNGFYLKEFKKMLEEKHVHDLVIDTHGRRGLISYNRRRSRRFRSIDEELYDWVYDYLQPQN